MQNLFDLRRKIESIGLLLSSYADKGELPMSHPILITGAAGGSQGATGRVVAGLLLKQGIPVRAFVRKLDARSDELRRQGAEIVAGDLLNPASVQAA
jgi:nucleoside-diphosphate-sugar epimerase